MPQSSLVEPLARAASSRHPVVAFAAEIARLTRGEARGARLMALAPKIKEAHRVALCSELLVGLHRGKPLPAEVAPSLSVLRDAERHLGRWLLLGEIATRAGDPKPLVEARRRAQGGAASARGAWAFVAWALGDTNVPAVRPNLELMARLSDRPSAERDASFLFRLASARAPSARPLLEGLAQGGALSDAVAVRAALHLCRDYGQEAHAEALLEAASGPRRPALRGLALAALYDCGKRGPAVELSRELQGAQPLHVVAWAGLVQAAAAGSRVGPLVSELHFRRVHGGACE
jgi:hypothetical protein